MAVKQKRKVKWIKGSQTKGVAVPVPKTPRKARKGK